MHQMTARASAGALAALWLASSPTHIHASVAAAPDALVDELAARTAAVATYSAHLDLRVQMRRFPFFGATFHGTTMFQAPDRFTVLLRQHALAQNYEHVLSDAENPGIWHRLYAISADPTLGGGSTIGICLTPRTRGDVDHATALIDAATRTIARFDWYFADGGHVGLTQRFAPIDGLLMVVHQDFDIRMPRNNVAAHADLSNYTITRALESTALR